MKKSVLLATVSIISSVSAASAADIAAMQTYDWSGLYAGFSIGHAGQDTGFEDPGYDWYGHTFHLRSGGFSYGLQGGYNWQNGPVVYGLEADITGFTNRHETIFSSDNRIENDLNWMATLRGRVGLGLDRTLLYATGGIAVADFDRSWIETADPSDSWPDLGKTKAGFIGGFGVEHAFTGNLSARFEGLLARFKENETINGDDFPMLNDDTVAMARFGLNYHFGGAAGSAVPMIYGTPADFSGLYAGASIGGAFSRLSQTDITYYWYGGTYDHDSAGITGGVHLGYNWQNGASLVGLEADLSLFSNSHDMLYDSGDAEISTGVEWMSSIRARTGLVAGNSLMYLTGGLAVARFDNRFNDLGDETFDMGGTDVGLIVGAGFEHAFTSRLTGRIEATYAAFPGATVEIIDGDNEFMRGSAQVASIKAGVSYLFGERAAADGGVAAPAVDWSGFYAGIEASGTHHVGSIWDRVYDDYGGTYALAGLGAGFGGHLGYNWQNGSFVYGVLADVGIFTNSEDDTSPGDRTVSSDLDWMATIRGRAGIASGSTYMYGTGGVAIANADLRYDHLPAPDPESYDLSGTRVGWVVGLGVEHAITERLSWKLEGLYATFKEEAEGNGETCSNTFTEPCEMDGFADNVSVKLGLSYKFGR